MKMNDKMGLGYPKRVERDKRFSTFFRRKRCQLWLSGKPFEVRSRKNSLRKSGDFRHALFCRTFRGMTKQILRDSILFDKRIHFADFFEKKERINRTWTATA